MDLDASRKAQLVVFMCKLLNIKEPKFPPGCIAHMVYNGKPGTYVYTSHGWMRLE